MMSDIDVILAERHTNGGDYWATADGRWGVGSPYSTFDVALMLSELEVPQSDPLMGGIAQTLLATWRNDGRFRAAPKGTMYPCHTANAARALCRLGYAEDTRLASSFAYLLETRHTDGGWRCNRAPLGRNAASDASNPGVTLAVLDAFRFTSIRDEPGLAAAVESLLNHWTVRTPLGPCNFGIGTLFNQVEYPFLRYNLFFFVYVLSHYEFARADERFHAAYEALMAKTYDGVLRVENPNRKLAHLDFCRRGAPSVYATKRMQEIARNLDVSD